MRTDILKETFYELLVFLILIGVLILFFAGIFWLNRIGCDGRWQGTYESEYKVLGGCRVNIDGKFIPENAVKQLANRSN
jgi:hypothetical protein